MAPRTQRYLAVHLAFIDTSRHTCRTETPGSGLGG